MSVCAPPPFAIATRRTVRTAQRASCHQGTPPVSGCVLAARDQRTGGFARQTGVWIGDYPLLQGGAWGVICDLVLSLSSSLSGLLRPAGALALRSGLCSLSDSLLSCSQFLVGLRFGHQIF
jgi:hypothetical protein